MSQYYAVFFVHVSDLHHLPPAMQETTNFPEEENPPNVANNIHIEGTRTNSDAESNTSSSSSIMDPYYCGDPVCSLPTCAAQLVQLDAETIPLFLYFSAVRKFQVPNVEARYPHWTSRGNHLAGGTSHSSSVFSPSIGIIISDTLFWRKITDGVNTSSTV